jgi:hypothetical protein
MISNWAHYERGTMMLRGVRSPHVSSFANKQGVPLGNWRAWKTIRSPGCCWSKYTVSPPGEGLTLLRFETLLKLVLQSWRRKILKALKQYQGRPHGRRRFLLDDSPPSELELQLQPDLPRRIEGIVCV